MTKADSFEQAADELYGLPLTDFTRTRDEIVGRLREQGEREAATAVKGLRKPTAPAWALNQLARRSPEDVERLLAVGERLRAAQEELLAGGERAPLQDAAREERELVAKLTRTALDLAADGGLGTGTSLEERIGTTLRAAALDEDTAADLRAGQLTREAEAVGLFGMGDSEERSPTPRHRQALEDARARAKETRRELEAAAKAAERAAGQVDKAKRRAEEAAARAKEAVGLLKEARSREVSARKAHERAERELAEAKRQAG